MGSVVFASAPAALELALPTVGCKLNYWHGWETRSRSTGGFERLWGVGWHHDAIAAWVPEINRSRSGWDRESNTNRPVGNARVEHSGDWMLGSVMATNTQGRGPALRMSNGVIPQDRANLYFFSLEPSNDGIGQPWPDKQVQSLITGTAALLLAAKLPASDVRAHFETAPGRKADPAGPSSLTNGRNVMWPMDLARTQVNLRMTWLIMNGYALGYPPPEGDDEMSQAQYDELNKKLDELLADSKLQKVRMNWLTNTWAHYITAQLKVVNAGIAELLNRTVIAVRPEGDGEVQPPEG